MALGGVLSEQGACPMAVGVAHGDAGVWVQTVYSDKSDHGMDNELNFNTYQKMVYTMPDRWTHTHTQYHNSQAYRNA